MPESSFFGSLAAGVVAGAAAADCAAGFGFVFTGAVDGRTLLAAAAQPMPFAST